MNPVMVAARALVAGRDRATAILTVVALALPHAVILSVVAGVMMFARRGEAPLNEIMSQPVHVSLAAFAAILLVVPAASMGSAAARLGLSRRSRDLAVLRLIGVSAMRTRLASVLDTVALSVIGVLAGTALYIVALPIWSLITFQEVRLSVAEMWMGFLPMLVCGLAMVLLAGLSALAAVHRVAVTPLGVARRSQAHGISWIWLLVGGLVGVAWFVVLTFGGGFAPMVVMSIALVLLAVFVALVNLIGTWTLSVIGWLMARLARRPAMMLAGRRLMDDPRSVWRSYGSFAFVAFLTGFMLPVVNLLGATDLSNAPDAPDTHMAKVVVADVSTGMLLTLGITVVLAAASTAVNQSIRAIDTVEETRSLFVMGARPGFLDRARRTEVLLPALVLIGGGVGVGIVFVAPMLSGQGVAAALAWTLPVTLLGILVVVVATEVVAPVRRRVLQASQR
ncbi:ABC transporter permease [Schaalia sp. 19OD2882]|uniref:ABC transporter permease n=1 Tax=Schaalia sp. 19OD2882 TaxID=2794089 RepID=UPI001C1ED336|nr:ABC transporter permease [Schaalia sp. 19OD2882]QWW19598.1 ABC transporter permease [Schaalia sp. 19OD2882]